MFLQIFSKTVQRSSVNVNVDVEALLPCVSTIRSYLGTVVEKERDSLIIENLPELVRKGGIITCDGVKIKETSAKYFDLMFEYINNMSICTSVPGQQR